MFFIDHPLYSCQNAVSPRMGKPSTLAIDGEVGSREAARLPDSVARDVKAVY